MSFDQPLPPFNAGDPTATFVGTSCLDFLLIELVPMTYRITSELDDGLDSTTTSEKRTTHNGDANTAAAPTIPTTTTGADGFSSREGGGPEDEAGEESEDRRAAVFHRLDSLGYRVGLGLVERFSRDRPRFHDTLDAIKFVCKDLWMLVFKKQVDNLKTNHRGVYVLTDHAFRPLARMSADPGGRAVVRAQPFLWFPCGILRGALAAMGISATVQAETNELPGAVFQIKTVAVSNK